ncbi:Lipase (class 3) [Seminavis robusta]|uniref:Lipase (Class 3) n=1 Tax=Seminavis robusta TaxID=568900 RepID=A0A9N8EBN3_9STRA|nr:Lipase (class 3) [Seminavis robusta]|eukprot:Sro933_g221750.1 Lipase (class 3) (454) ;mRNA; r:10848-12209
MPLTTSRKSRLVIVLLSFAVGSNALPTLRHGNLHEHPQQSAISARRQSFDVFPHLLDVGEMANLSHAVYKYKHYNYDDVCEHWNNETATTITHEKGVTCHWYRHDKHLGTQVMIVSSKAKDYLAVVFAGTDDLFTALLDVDVRKIRFGTDDLYNKDKTNASRVPVSLDCADCRVHEGFNNAVFANHIFDDIYIRVEKLRPKFSRLFTTGHSLGGANSIMTALGLAVEFQKKHIGLKYPVTSLNFGSPQVGNVEFRDFINSNFLTHPNSTQNSPYLVIWRVVLGWDLVPRLPQFFEHIGHTVQMNSPECNDKTPYCIPKRWLPPYGNHDRDANKTKQAFAFYHHIGDASMNYSGVPASWSATPYLWVPGALLSHAIDRYATFLHEWFVDSPKTFVHDFVNTNSSSSSDDALIDDDAYAEPPDDDAAQLLEQRNNEVLSETPQRLLDVVKRWLCR